MIIPDYENPFFNKTELFTDIGRSYSKAPSVRTFMYTTLSREHTDEEVVIKKQQPFFRKFEKHHRR